MRTVIALLLLLWALPGVAAEPPVAPPQAPPATAPPAPRLATEKDLVASDDYHVSLSLPTEDDRAAWIRPGLRVELSFNGGLLFGSGPAPRITLFQVQLRPRLRLDRSWSLAATFGYGLARGSYTGMRWSAVIEPIFHPIPSLGISLGVGYAGLSVSNASVAPDISQEIASRTLGSNERMYSCSGAGFVGQARVEYLFVVGPLFSTGPYLLAEGQWTGCTETFTRTDLETGQPAQGRQWWLGLGGNVGWWFSWR